MAHLLTDYFKLKPTNIRKDQHPNHAHTVEIVAIKEDYLYLDGYITDSNHPSSWKRIFNLGSIKFKLLKRHKTPTQVYVDVFKQFTKELNKTKYQCTMPYLCKYSLYKNGEYEDYIFEFSLGEIYSLQDVEEDHIYLNSSNQKSIRVNKENFNLVFKKV